MVKPKVCFLQPDNKGRISGGFLYNERIINGLKAWVDSCTIIPLSSDFPEPSERSLGECDHILNQLDEHTILVIDSLILGAVPDLIEKYQHKFVLIGLVHLPLFLNETIDLSIRENMMPREIQTFNRVDSIVVPSGFLQNLLVAKGVKARKIHMIKPGIDENAKTRTYPEIPANFLCVSNILPLKRQLDILLALSNLKHDHWHMTFCGGIHGNKDYYNQLINTMEKNKLSGRVSFTGKIAPDQLADYYLHADLFIYASEFETYGMALTEAMSFKLPIVTTNAGAIPETVPGNCARFFEVGNIRQLQDQLEVLFNQPQAYAELAGVYKENKWRLPTWHDTTIRFYDLINQYAANGN